MESKLSSFSLVLLLLSSLFLSTRAGYVPHEHKSVQEYEINLDDAPNVRYMQLINDEANQYNNTVWTFWDTYFAKDKALTDVLYGLVDLRGKEVDEMQQEIEGLASASGLPLKFVQGIQMLYELQTLMVPIVNFTHSTHESYPMVLAKALESVLKEASLPLSWASALSRLPWRGPGCTGIIARNSADGTVSHARDLDFSPAILGNLVYTGIFKKSGKELFRAQMIAGYTMVITGARFGKNGYTIERNTRYTTHFGGNTDMLKNLVHGRQLNGWTLRKTMEAQAEYEGAVAALKAAPYASTEYSIISGVRKGTILSRDPDSVAFVQELGKPGGNPMCEDDYIIITNFDYYWHDVREWFDPTGSKGIGHPRRIEAQKLLNGTSELTPEFLFSVIDAPGVFADTIFQAVMNVETGLWNVSQPSTKATAHAAIE